MPLVKKEAMSPSVIHLWLISVNYYNNLEFILESFKYMTIKSMYILYQKTTLIHEHEHCI